MLHQRTIAKADAKSKKQHLADLSVYSAFRAQGETVFTGYDYLTTDSMILGLIVNGESVKSASAGDIAEVILAETSLYPESGGQEADADQCVVHQHEPFTERHADVIGELDRRCAPQQTQAFQ